MDKTLFEEEKNFAANGSETYYFVFWIDETGEVQLDNGNFRANIEFDSSTGGLTSTVKPRLSDYIEELYNDGSVISSVRIADNESKQLVNLNSNQNLMMLDQGTYGTEYRYYGAFPDNYVEYNGELWRIISSSKVFSSEEDVIGEQRVRIIRDESIGYHAWYGSYNNSSNWTTSTLMSTLNNPYYNSTKGTCYIEPSSSMPFFEVECDYEKGFGTFSDVYGDQVIPKGLNNKARNLIDDALWYLGGTGNYELYADDWYNIERYAVGYGSNPTRYTNLVGLMYPSDYLYATDLSVCKSPGMNSSWDGGYSISDCKGTDWLFNNDFQWFISPSLNSANRVWGVDYEYGYISDSIVPTLYYTAGVRPVVVLKTDVRVVDGNGTSGNPYKIALN
jgi:hypothetical protein